MSTPQARLESFTRHSATLQGCRQVYCLHFSMSGFTLSNSNVIQQDQISEVGLQLAEQRVKCMFRYSSRRRKTAVHIKSHPTLRKPSRRTKANKSDINSQPTNQPTYMDILIQTSKQYILSVLTTGQNTLKFKKAFF